MPCRLANTSTEQHPPPQRRRRPQLLLSTDADVYLVTLAQKRFGGELQREELLQQLAQSGLTTSISAAEYAALPQYCLPITPHMQPAPIPLGVGC